MPEIDVNGARLDDRPEEFNQAVLDFLGRTGNGASA
jgi:hypothetical protein